ncbi:hypothetical protein CPC08DRAFT_527664 [Agrocybe pediades]|nr:hypothetical protein CPC08DRAFT_527664 [Agrocybe pediades]
MHHPSRPSRSAKTIVSSWPIFPRVFHSELAEGCGHLRFAKAFPSRTAHMLHLPKRNRQLMRVFQSFDWWKCSRIGRSEYLDMMYSSTKMASVTTDAEEAFSGRQAGRYLSCEDEERERNEGREDRRLICCFISLAGG